MTTTYSNKQNKITVIKFTEDVTPSQENCAQAMRN